ncbi:hypothetical protein ANO11243_092820 [Dothideomycetidae sp. 11243]|nr:hypothetical protein ANO11243_092820 [fungal sp. No.11243]
MIEFEVLELGSEWDFRIGEYLTGTRRSGHYARRAVEYRTASRIPRSVEVRRGSGHQHADSSPFATHNKTHARSSPGQPPSPLIRTIDTYPPSPSFVTQRNHGPSSGAIRLAQGAAAAMSITALPAELLEAVLRDLGLQDFKSLRAAGSRTIAVQTRASPQFARFFVNKTVVLTSKDDLDTFAWITSMPSSPALRVSNLTLSWIAGDRQRSVNDSYAAARLAKAFY